MAKTMNPNKYYSLIVQPISEITEQQTHQIVLATNDVYWMSGKVYWLDGCYCCSDDEMGKLFNITHFAILPK